MLIFSGSIRNILWCGVIITFHIGCTRHVDNTPEAPEDKLNVLLFSKTGSFRHECIEPGSVAIKEYFAKNNMSVTHTEEDAYFTENKLSEFDAIMFFQTTGNILDSVQQESLVKYVQSGKGFVGIHAAADAEYDWPWYIAMIGVQFANHPEIQKATVVKVDTQHMACKHLPDRWTRTDEWYNFTQLPANTKILLTVDESTYQGGAHDSIHPMSWYHTYDGGRVFYTAMGHTVESYQDTMFLRHILEGTLWAARE